jgi:hypothetical protein
VNPLLFLSGGGAGMAGPGGAAARLVPMAASAAGSARGDWRIFRGEDVALDFTLDPPADCTGWAVTFVLTGRHGRAAVLTRPGVVVTGPAGKFRVTVSSADTASLDPGLYVWDCRRTDQGGRYTLAHGYAFLQRELAP